MAKPRFRRAVEKVARPIIEPLGFEFYVQNEPGYGGAYSFLRPWKGKWMQGIALHTRRGSKGFTVELGVVTIGGFFMSSPFENMGPWREFGLRKDLGEIVHATDPLVDFDFIAYQEQADLEEVLRQTLEQALEYGPAEWERMGRRLLSGT
jgi:hypothetical protein